jgi:hypothetical protein
MPVRAIAAFALAATGRKLHSGQRYGKKSIYQRSIPSDLGGLNCCVSFGRGSNFASIPDPIHFIFAV